MLDWSVLYAKNAVELKDGTVSALMPAETAVKAKLATASVTTAGGTAADGISDYVEISIATNSRADLISKIEEARNVLANNPTAPEYKLDELNDAIGEAEKLLNSPSATEDDFTDGVTKLAQAISDFLSSDGGGGGRRRGGSSSVQKYYNISVEETENGRVELSQTSVSAGNSLTVTAIPDEGYTVADMLINGRTVGRDAVYTLNSVNEDITVKVIFAEKSDLPFTDVIASDWFYPYVKDAFENGIMHGASETRFEPETPVTRAMFVTVLHRMDGEKLEGENVFRDVADGMYYRNAVAWANKNGIVLGVSETEFAPDERITREQMAAILYRYARYRGIDTSVGESTNILSYDDFADVSEYAADAIQYALGSGLIVGRTQTTLNPKDSATRAETATIFVRFAELIK